MIARARDVLGAAFVADPLMIHAFGPGQAGAEALARLFDPVLEACRRHGGLLVREEAAAAWLPGSLVPLPWGARLRAGFARLPLMLPPAGLLRLLRHEAACEAAIRARFGKRRFAYLWLLGVTPEGRRRGLGRDILDDALGAMAGDFDLCVLKTENPQAAKFYRRMGFALQDRLTVPASRLDVQFLARPTRLQRACAT